MPGLELDGEDAGRDERQEHAVPEVEGVVRRAGDDILDPPEGAAALLDHLEPDELEGVVLVLGGGRQRLARDLEHGATLDAAVDPTVTRAAAGTVARGDDLRLDASGEQERARLEPAGVGARLLDEERAVEAVRTPDPPDGDER